MNTTVAGKLLADLGIAHNFSDSGMDSSENAASNEAVTAALSIDFVQRFNFSATEGGAITFRSPQASTEGYASMLVFDEDGAAMFPRLLAPLMPRPSRVKCYITTTGASTMLAESIFYNVKVRPNTTLVRPLVRRNTRSA